ncbi:hypothetical protein PC118_g12340 [Phytophthora cactorum]|uniref:Uncharacterized protein n=1 Tax=Phytophthora cactorum TaxID=29920 RepID=A0A8T1FSG6_9STRA|nr:hypothetical protein PC118_g12340 [Phytophthora cactorum]
MHEELLLDETAKLNDGAYFGKNFRPGDRDIHVLVELPEIPKDVLHYKRIACPGSRTSAWCYHRSSRVRDK